MNKKILFIPSMEKPGLDSLKHYGVLGMRWGTRKGISGRAGRGVRSLKKKMGIKGRGTFGKKLAAQKAYNKTPKGKAEMKVTNKTLAAAIVGVGLLSVYSNARQWV